MIIKEQHLDQCINPIKATLFIVYGTDEYLLSQACSRIKNAYSSSHETDFEIMHLNQHITFNDVVREANSYSLLAEQKLLDLSFAQKSFDSAAQKIILKYLERPNSKSLILMRAPEIVEKNLSWLFSHNDCVLVNASPLPQKLLQQWIIHQLKQYNLRFDPQVPVVVQQYTQNNMYACAQLLEKLMLICEPQDVITVEFILKYLDDQSEYPIYELTDACLNADYNKAIQRLRQAQNHSVEPTLLLWCLTQEIRQLINLHYQIQQGKSLQQACQILKIWSSKVGYYEKSIQRLSYESLLNLLQQAQAIDRLLKTGGIQKIWIELERLIMQM